jgi:hypothetical protein
MIFNEVVVFERDIVMAPRVRNKGEGEKIRGSHGKMIFNDIRVIRVVAD